LLLRNRVKTYDNYNEYGIEPTEINVKKCIKYVARAWDTVTQTTIKNCWLKADILPKNNDDEIDMDFDVESEVYNAHEKELDEIQELIDKLDIENPFTAEEYIQYDDSEITTDMISNEEILKVVLPNNDDNQEKEAEDSDPLPPITHNEAIDYYNKVILYLEQQEKNFGSKHEELKYVKKLKKEALKQHFFSARQTDLNSFINVN
jgi:hypothetical protein